MSTTEKATDAVTVEPLAGRAPAERIAIKVRVQLRLRTRRGIENEIYVKTAQLDPLELDPMQLVCEDQYDNGSWGTFRRITMTFGLEDYDSESRTATYKPYEMRRSDKRRELLVTGWDFSRERPQPIVSGESAVAAHE